MIKILPGEPGNQLTSPQGIVRRIGGNSIEPCRKFQVCIHLWQSAERLQKGILCKIICLFAITYQVIDIVINRLSYTRRKFVQKTRSLPWFPPGPCATIPSIATVFFLSVPCKSQTVAVSKIYTACACVVIHNEVSPWLLARAMRLGYGNAFSFCVVERTMNAISNMTRVVYVYLLLRVVSFIMVTYSGGTTAIISPYFSTIGRTMCSFGVLFVTYLIGLPESKGFADPCKGRSIEIC